jgi:hypothetical protein
MLFNENNTDEIPFNRSVNNVELVTPEYVAHKAVEAVKRNLEEVVIPEIVVKFLGKGWVLLKAIED